MIIYGVTQKSKKKKTPKHIREQYESWLLEILKPQPLFCKNPKVKVVKVVPSLKVPPGRETPKYNSLNTGLTPATKPLPNIYTGDKMKGIATMHKSNAVPVFTDEQAKDISSMRR